MLGTLLLSGCAATPLPHSEGVAQQIPFNAAGVYGSRSSGAYDSDDSFHSGGGKPISVPHRGHVTASVDLVTRPDQLTADFAIREVRPSSSEALVAARATMDAVLDRLGKATGGAASMRPRGSSAEKVIRHGQFAGVVVTVDGELRVRLANELDFWARSQLFTTVLELIGRLHDESASADEPLRTVKFENLAASLENPEAFRQHLMERWIARARGFADLAEAKQAPLALLDCSAPQVISQNQISLEEVTLGLAIDCRIGVVGAARCAIPPTR